MLGPILLTLSILAVADLSEGGIKCPEGCRCHLLTTDCSNLQLKSIPSDVDPEVQVLHLSGNNFKDVNFPPTMKSLQQVYIVNSTLQTISFENLPELNTIDLSQNVLTNFSAIGLEKLNTLNLSHNRELELQSGTTSSISNQLQLLDMSSCHVKSLKFLEKLPNLQILYLKENSIKNLSIEKASSLTHLIVRGGHISELDVFKLTKYPNLIYLDVSNNRDIRIELSMKNKTDYCLPLEHFTAAATGISEIKIATLCKLQVGDFSDNGINIKKTTFQTNSELKSLNLSFNEIREIHKDSFKNNQKLLDLDLARNLLENVVWADNLVNLKTLNLSSNKISTLEDITLLNLLYFDASDNKITNVSRNLSKRFPKLEYLDLSYNLVDELRPLEITTLKTLILKYCQILMVGKNSLSKMIRLQYLDLTGNKLMRLDYTTLSSIPSLQTVRLANNSWLCDCQDEQNDGIKKLYIYIAVNHSLTNTADLICNEPQKRTWKDACGAAWSMSGNTEPSSMKTSMILLAIFFFTLFILAGVIYIKHRVKNRIREVDHVVEEPLNRALPQTVQTTSLRRVQSEVSVRLTTTDDFGDNPPSYEEAIRMPPMTDVERMTRSMDVLVERRIALPTIPE